MSTIYHHKINIHSVVVVRPRGTIGGVTSAIKLMTINKCVRPVVCPQREERERKLGVGGEHLSTSIAETPNDTLRSRRFSPLPLFRCSNFPPLSLSFQWTQLQPEPDGSTHLQRLLLSGIPVFPHPLYVYNVLRDDIVYSLVFRCKGGIAAAAAAAETRGGANRDV